MTTTTDLYDNLAQRNTRALSAPVLSHYGNGQERTVPRTLPNLKDTQGRSVPERAPLSHPIAEQLQGRAIAEQVKLVLADRCRFLGEFPSRRVMQDRCERIVTSYSELKTMGFQITEVTSFGLKHARALLESWKTRGLANKTIYNRWSALRGWVIALGKHGMLGTIEEYWPDFNSETKPTTSARQLTPEQLQERSDYLASKSDKTAYLVDRLAREVGMVREDALEMEHIAALAVAQGHGVLRCGNGASARVYTKISEHQRLFKEAADFMTERKREKLSWPGLSNHEAIAKYTFRLSYVTRTLFPKKDDRGERA